MQSRVQSKRQEGGGGKTRAVRKIEAAGVKAKLTLPLLIILPVLLFFLSMSLGRYEVSVPQVYKILLSRLFAVRQDWSSAQESVILQIRFPRTLMAMLVGAGLAIAGASFQGLFRNPLVSPDILGVSAGAGFGACLGILVSSDVILIQSLAIAFGLLAVAGAYVTSRLRAGTSILMLVLAGVIVGALFQALIGIVKLCADPLDKLPTIVYWLMGSIANASYRDFLWGAPPILIGSTVLLLMRWKINILSLGEEEAKSLGLNIQRVKWLVIIASTLITAAGVSLFGIIGWIGLVVPHVGRMLVGPNHKVLLPSCISIGAFFLLAIDDVARFATAAEIPLSILTAIIGAPIFAYLLRKTGGRWT